MKSDAFTLIELLVVVLIIGILSAIALPQYQVAVFKSRFTRLQVLAASVRDAQKIYKIANGQYATQLDELDISLPAGYTVADSSYTVGSGDNEQTVPTQYAKYPDGLWVYIIHAGGYVYIRDTKRGVGFLVTLNSGARWCVSYTKTGDSMCLSLGGQYQNTSCREAGDTTSHGCNNYALP